MSENILKLSKIRPYKNMPDLIAEQLKESILQGTLKGGTPLKQEEIAKQFDVSLIPVREALIQLESYKLVTCIRNKGTMVTKLSLTELRHLFALRRVLEGGSIALISGEVEPDIIKKLEVLLEKMTLQKDRVSNMRYNRLFHQLLCDTAQNPQMSELYANIFVKVERYLMYIYDTIGDFEKDLSAHREMLTLLKSQDYGTLQEKMNQHTLESETNFLEYLKAQGYQEPFDFDSLLPFKKS